MDTQGRLYDKALDKQWSRDVHQKAKGVVEELLSSAGGVMSSSEIKEEMKRKYPTLCDDNIRDRQYPKMPYWKHLVSTAIDNLQRQGKVRKADNGWVCVTKEAPPPPTPKPVVAPVPQPMPIVPPPPDIKQQLKDKLFQLDAHAFEVLVGKVLNALGIHQMRVSGRTADGGIDGEGEIPIWGVKIAFQAKKWAEGNTVGIDPVQRLVGSVVSGGYDRGMFVTTSGFTQGAKEVAERLTSRIVLIDGDKLIDIMVRNNLGISTVPIVRQEIDSGFFDSSLR